MTFAEIIETALQKPTLTEALMYASVVECDRVVRLILQNPKQYIEGKPYETYFGVLSYRTLF